MEASPGPGTFVPRSGSRLVGSAPNAPAFSLRARPPDACAPLGALAAAAAPMSDA